MESVPAGMEFSPHTRVGALKRYRSEVFDLLIVGGGITGAACARDAASRGLSVALIEQSDFASGTSSKSSKLIHGGLRYLENLEFGLVFEALAERTLLLKTAPHMVRPLPFYFPVFKGDPHNRFQLGLGMILYDLLALFRAPGLHRRFGKRALLKDIPFLRQEGLKGGFRYFDASMWDDALTIEVLRSATTMGAACANYVRAVSPIWSEEAMGAQIVGYRAQDLEAAPTSGASGEFEIRARRTILATGPWADLMGHGLAEGWRTWLKPSKGVHLVFDLKRIPVPGALVMSHPEDGRIAFVMPRPDLGPGVTIVGTTDGPTPTDPARAAIEPADVQYLLRLLDRYFEPLQIKASDILSGYVGVRPLVGESAGEGGGNLAKVSREHEIRTGPGGVTLVAGGKYTTHRKMAEEIVDFSLHHGAVALRAEASGSALKPLRSSRTHEPVNPLATPEAMERAHSRAESQSLVIPPSLIDRYGLEAFEIARLHSELVQAGIAPQSDPEGFPWLGAQFAHLVRTGMVTHLEDFYFRRIPLFLARADHGWGWAKPLAVIWARELGLDPETSIPAELERLRQEIARHEAWRKADTV